MDFTDIAAGYRNEIIECTQQILKFESIKSEGTSGRPFGEGISRTLNYVLNLGKRLGFKTKDLDGYAGYLEFGNGEQMVGVLTHLDVVPPGDGWTFPPFEGRIHQGKIYGRGAVDDKGPAVSAVFAAKAVMDSGLAVSKRLRLIFGTDEENQWEGIKYYLEHEELPCCGIVPDAKYPVINSEKGILNLKISKNFRQDLQRNRGIRLKSLKGGSRPNMVPDLCRCEIEPGSGNREKIHELLNEYVKSTGYDIKILSSDNSRIVIGSYGISAHGSRPEEGKNAVSQMIMFLSTIKVDNSDTNSFIQIIAEKIGTEYNGQKLGIGLSDEISGDLTINVGIIEFDMEKGDFIIDIRYPVTYKDTQIIEKIRDTLKDTGVNVEITTFIPPLHIPKESELVQKLLHVYLEMTGESAEPLTSGGGTYARAIKNAVAFGTLFPGQPDVAHQKDEHICIEYLIKNTQIYAKAIYELIK